MTVVDLFEVLAGGALLFFVPGYAVTRAVFPEWRLSGPLALRRTVETVVLAFVLSVVLTVLVGYVLLSVAPGGFRATWSDPLLEAGLAAVALVAAAVAALEGAFSRTPPPSRRPEVEAGERGAWEITVELEKLHAEERRLLRALRRGVPPEERPALELRLEELRRAIGDRQRFREAAYDA